MRSNIHSSVERIFLNEIAARLDDIAHQPDEHFIGLVGVVDADLEKRAGLGVERVGISLGSGGYLTVDRVSRTSVAGIYAAGDCTGLLPLASVAAMQGRIAVAHQLGDAVRPLRTDQVASNIFTSPEIATVGSGTGALR